MRLAALLLALIAQTQAVDYCNAYAECVAVSRLEERLCLGNSLKRPFWLPESDDPHSCHDQLQPDYKRLEQLEMELDAGFVSCMSSKPADALTAESSLRCQKSVLEVPRFSAGRTIDYVPTRCFAGVDKRIERQCGPLRLCCAQISACEGLLSASPQFDRLKAAAFEMRKRAHDCENGRTLTPFTDLITSVHPTGDKDPFSASSTSGSSTSESSTQSPELITSEVSTSGGLSGYGEEEIAPIAPIPESTSAPIPETSTTELASTPTPEPALPETTTFEKSVAEFGEEEQAAFTETPTIITAEESSQTIAPESISEGEFEEITATVTSGPLEIEETTISTTEQPPTETTTISSSYNELNANIFDRLDKHEKQVKELLEREGVDTSVGLAIENAAGPKLTFPTGTIGQGSTNVAIEVPASGDKMEEAEADFGISIGKDDRTNGTGDGELIATNLGNERVKIITTLPLVSATPGPINEAILPKSVTLVPRTSGGPMLNVRFHVASQQEIEQAARSTRSTRVPSSSSSSTPRSYRYRILLHTNERPPQLNVLKPDAGVLSVRKRLVLNAPLHAGAILSDCAQLGWVLQRYPAADEGRAGYASLHRTKRHKLIEEALSSLFQAADAPNSQQNFAGDSVRNPAEADFGESESAVTSSPLILISQNEDGVRRAPVNRRIACMKTNKAYKLRRILTLLGEKGDSKDMKQIKVLLDNWQNEVRATLLDAKKRNKNKAIDQALDALIDHFDSVNAGILATSPEDFDNSDYPEEDAQIAAMECEPLDIDGSGEGSGDSEGSEVEGSGTFADEPSVEFTPRGDKVAATEGKEQLLISQGNLQLDDQQTMRQRIDARPVDTEWMSKYRAEIERIQQDDQLTRNETTCDAYMRCRNQMHLALDGCAWRFASVKILMSLAESSESLLYRGDALCNPEDRPIYESLYNLMFRRNRKIKQCLAEKNKDIFDKAVCVPFPPERAADYDQALIRVLSAEYPKSSECFMDANLIQEKCGLLRECCPHFDRCREDSLDIGLEQAILSKTAQINERKQECLRQKARKNFKTTVRNLLAPKSPRDSWDTIAMIRSGDIGSKVGGFDRLRARTVFRM